MFISLTDITIQAGARRLFAHTHWDIHQNEHWAILGGTGSGKSILAKAIAHRLPISHGQILYFFDSSSTGRTSLNPREILTLSSEVHRDFLNQYASYHQARWQSFESQGIPSVSELLTATSIEQGSPFEVIPPAQEDETDRIKREEAIRLFKLDYLLDRKIIHISHGESRKVLIARLIMQSPRLLVLDEPFSGLDGESRALLAGGIETIIQNGTPQVLFISSRIEDVPAGISHFLLVDNNQVVACGERQELQENDAFRSFQAARPSGKPGYVLSTAFTNKGQQYSDSLAAQCLPESETVIEMENVNVTYGKVNVLKKVNWQVKRGEHWALLGANGAGKTTLLSLILADNPQAYANKVTLFGKRRGSGESIWEIKRHIGWVSPELQIYSVKNATGKEVVCSGFFDTIQPAQIFSPQQIATAEEWLEAFGIESFSDQPYQSLSTGQQRLVLLARAVVKNPPVLILDEPCQGLDDYYRMYFLELIDQLCVHTPLTLVYISHYASEIPSAIDHTLRLKHGEVFTSP